MAKKEQKKYITNLGDADPIENGGKFLYVNSSNPNDADLEILEPPLLSSNRKFYTIYRLPLERLKTVGDCLIPFEYNENWQHSLDNYKVWFSDKIDKIACYVGLPNSELCDYFCSEEPLDRATGYIAIGDYFGYFHLDNYPLELTRSEVKKRYRKELKKGEK